MKWSKGAQYHWHFLGYHGWISQSWNQVFSLLVTRDIPMMNYKPTTLSESMNNTSIDTLAIIGDTNDCLHSCAFHLMLMASLFLVHLKLTEYIDMALCCTLLHVANVIRVFLSGCHHYISFWPHWVYSHSLNERNSRSHHCWYTKGLSANQMAVWVWFLHP